MVNHRWKKLYSPLRMHCNSVQSLQSGSISCVITSWFPICLQGRTGSGNECAEESTLNIIYAFKEWEEVSQKNFIKSSLLYRATNKYVENIILFGNVLNFLIDLILIWVNTLNLFIMVTYLLSGSYIC